MMYVIWIILQLYNLKCIHCKNILLLICCNIYELNVHVGYDNVIMNGELFQVDIIDSLSVVS